MGATSRARIRRSWLRDVGKPLVLPVLPRLEAKALHPVEPAPPLLDRADAQVGEHGDIAVLQLVDLGGSRKLAVDDDQVEIPEPVAHGLAIAAQHPPADRERPRLGADQPRIVETPGAAEVGATQSRHTAATALVAFPRILIPHRRIGSADAMKVFVTGGTGFIGGHVVRRLRERGDEVVAWVRNPVTGEALTALGAELLEGDLSDRAALAAGMEGCDAVIHGAAVYEVGIPKNQRPAMYEANVVGTENVLGAALDAGIPKVVYISTIGAFGNTHGEVVDETYEHPGKSSPPTTRRPSTGRTRSPSA